MDSILAVLTPPQTTALTTLGNVKMHLGIDSSDDDIYLGQLIDRVSSQIVGLIGHPLGLQTVMETFRRSGFGCGSPATSGLIGYYFYHPLREVQPLILTALPIVAITSVTEDGNPLTQGADYEVEPLSGLLWRLSGDATRCSWTASNVTVSYSAGYVLPQDDGTRTLPFDIEDAALSLIQAAYSSRGRDPSVVLEVTEGVGRTQYAPPGTASPMGGTLQALAARYRSPIS